MSQSGSLTGGGGGSGSPTWVGGAVTTTDATPTTLATLATTSNAAYVVFALATAWNAADGQCAGYNVSAAACNVAGTLTVAAPDHTGDKGASFTAALPVTVVASGTSIVIQVTGAVGKTIDWRGGFWYVVVS